MPEEKVQHTSAYHYAWHETGRKNLAIPPKKTASKKHSLPTPLAGAKEPAAWAQATVGEGVLLGLKGAEFWRPTLAAKGGAGMSMSFCWNQLFPQVFCFGGKLSFFFLPLYITNVNEPFRGSTLGVTRQGYHTWQYLHTSLQKNLGKLQMQTIPHCMRSLPPGVLTVIDIGRFTHYKWVVYPPEMGCLPTTNGWFAHFKQGGLPTR